MTKSSSANGYITSAIARPALPKAPLMSASTSIAARLEGVAQKKTPGPCPGVFYWQGNGSVVMLWHFFQLLLGPTCCGVNFATLVAHELKIAQGHRDRLGAKAEEPADINDDVAGGAHPMHMGHFANLVVISAVNGRAFKRIGRQFGGRHTDMI